MDALIHAGMHKTGSSSIQQTLYDTEIAGLYYPKWPTGNHSGLVVLMFEDAPEEHHGFKAQGITPDELADRRARWQTRLTKALESGEHDRVILSAERLVASPPAALQRLKAFFEPYCDSFRVMAYVRPPVGYMTSAFQQRLKGDLDRIQLQWPAYRRSFEKLDQIFGRENVFLKPFYLRDMVGGDVVLDFAHETGLDLVPDQVARVNEGLSLEAVALLFMQRRFGKGFVRGFPGAPRANQAFIDALARIGTGKLELAPALTDPVIEANRADLDWIEDRLGAPLRDSAPKGAHPIASQQDLVAVALDHLDALCDLLADQLRPGPEPSQQGLIRNLELMRSLYT